MLICLLWVVCVSTAYGQHTEDASVDTLKQSSREQQMQARLENYVQLLSTRKKPERPRVMVMPVMGFRTSQMSYGLMVAAMRRTGGYIKAKYSFSNTPSDDFECNDVGMSGEDGEVQWYTGKTEKSRLSVTGGIVQRLWKPFYLYAGVGYGTRTLVWETKTIPWRVWKLRSEESCLPDQWYFRWVCKRTALNIWREIWELELFFNR